jgi:hypothetical protein
MLDPVEYFYAAVQERSDQWWVLVVMACHFVAFAFTVLWHAMIPGVRQSRRSRAIGAIILLGILVGGVYFVAGYYSWRGYILMGAVVSPEHGRGAAKWAFGAGAMAGYAGYLLWLTTRQASGSPEGTRSKAARSRHASGRF